MGQGFFGGELCHSIQAQGANAATANFMLDVFVSGYLGGTTADFRAGMINIQIIIVKTLAEGGAFRVHCHQNLARVAYPALGVHVSPLFAEALLAVYSTTCC